MENIILDRIAFNLNLPKKSVENTVALFETGATIPFISRYRKEQTGSLDEVQIEDIHSEMTKFKDLQKRKETILKAIEEQGKLTDDLKRRIQDTWEPIILEDIYLPYKQKRKTRATVAKEKGLEPLAKELYRQQLDNVDGMAEKFLSNDVENIDDALQGARDIISEWLNEDEAVRAMVRIALSQGATIKSKVARGKQEAGEKFKDYFEFEEPLNRCPSHRLLAIRRGEDEGFLRVSVAPDEEDTLYRMERKVVKSRTESSHQVKLALEDAYKRLLQPSIETEFRNLSKEKADDEAISVFAENLRQLLLSPPLGQKRIMGIDPGFRTGCKVVCLAENGDLLKNTNIYPHPPQNKKFETEQELKMLVDQYDINAIAVGNGTAGRETISLCKSIDFGKKVEIFSVNENGASIYSASKIAREEFPDHDVTVRGSVSIARRLMDPLAELVKIDAKSIGVGQYQHDVNQVKLRDRLDRVVESCVNSVGINLNTASKHLLNYVSRLGSTIAQNIVDYRTENGAFTSRKQLQKVPRLGGKAFEQSAGFLRITDAKNPLDNTAVHPESYHIVKAMAKDLGCEIQDLIDKEELRKQLDLRSYVSNEFGLPTLQDIVKELAKPGLDPRGEAKSFEFADIHSIEDVNVGMIIPGIVTNITNFGAFVDIGVKQDGLVHISQIANKFVKNPADVVSLNQKVQVKVIDLDVGRKRINLSMKF